MEKKGAADGKSQKHLTFAIGNENYGIPINTVKEIIGMMNITSVPKTPAFIKGVINLRGKIIPIMDLRLKFGLSEREYTERTCIIVVDIQGKSGSRNIGIIVDTVSEVLSINQDDIEKTPQGDIQNEGNFIEGMGKMKDKVIMLVDINKILNTEELNQLNNMKGGV